MLNAAVPYRRDDRESVRVPIVMPLVEVDVDATGHLAVRLDHEPYSADGSLGRDDLQRVLGDITTDLGTAVRVEVHEADHSSFTDILTPEQVEPRPLTAVPESASPLGEVAGQGFLPNEEVAVAVVVAHQVARADGTVHLRLPPALLASHPGRLVFMGKQSGTVTVNGGAA